MKFYNTLTRKVEEFKPIDDQNVRVYTCGPTVYDRAHVGNLATYIFADTLHRALAVHGYSVTRVMNYTDVDDKTVGRSQEVYPELEPQAALEQLTSHYTALFLEDMKKAGNDINNVTFARATDHIEPMKQLVSKLHKDGFAYITDDGVYFSIETYKNSGKNYGQLLKITESNTSQARIQNDEYDKESIHDFALWKAQKPGEPAWEFEIDGKNLKGRPGWHIECSAMSRSHLGQPFDIHTGGVDNIFPHHENEIAQSTAGEENPTMASMFIHREHILIDNKKMAKSAHNFYTLDDIAANGYDPIAFRLLILQSHYRSQAHFSWKNLVAAQRRLGDLRNMADLRWQPKTDGQNYSIDFSASQETLQQHLLDDLNTPQLLANLSTVENTVQTQLVHEHQTAEFHDFLIFVDSVLGLNLLGSADITAEQKQLIARREAARSAKDWQASDELRNELQKQGIGVRDTDHGTIWYRHNVL